MDTVKCTICGLPLTDPNHDAYSDVPPACPGAEAMPEALQPFGIGSKVYSYDRFDQREGQEVEYTVVGESCVSWLISRWHSPESFHLKPEQPCYKLPKRGEGETRTIKVSKRGSAHKTFYLNLRALRNQRWADRNRYAISDHVKRLQDIDILRAIANITGYVEKG